MAIDWESTHEAFGTSCPADLVGKRPKVICSCDGCGVKKEIAVRVKSRLAGGQMLFSCPSCVGKRRSSDISIQLKRQWSEQDYSNARMESSKRLWCDEAFKATHSDAVRNAMSSVDMSAKLSQRYSDSQAREKIRKISKLNWSNSTFRKKHGTAMGRPEVRDKISKAAKASWLRDSFRDRMAVVRAAQSKNISSIQSKLYKILDDLNVAYFKEGQATKIGFYVFDCLLPSAGILIECQGDYWHSLAKSQMRDKQKFTYISRYYPQYKLVYVWEREFYQADRVASRFRSLLNLAKVHRDFSFKDVMVRKIDATKDFLELYHYLGPGRGGIKYGAFHEGVLVAVAVFSKPLRQNLSFEQNALECSRFCIHPNYQKRNFASWFLSRVAKNFVDIQLYSYADTTVGHSGVIYKAAGWRHHHTVPADYWYMDQDGYVMHKKTLYNRAINLKMSESEFASKFEYQKIHGGVKECFIYKYLKSE